MGGRYEAVKELEPVIRRLIAIRAGSGAMNLYAELLSIRTELNELAERSRKLHEDYNRDAARAFAEELEVFSRPQLILIRSCGIIGDTGLGKQFDAREQESFVSLSYHLIIRESGNRLLERYAAFSAFWSRDSLIRFIVRNIGFGDELQAGLYVLALAERLNGKRAAGHHAEIGNEAAADSDSAEYSVLAEKPPSFTDQNTLLVGMDNSDGVYFFFEFREDAAGCIEWLRDRFYDWMYGQKGIHPFRWHHRPSDALKKSMFEGWLYIQNHQDFVDWVNTRVYGCPVGREVSYCPLQEPAAKLSF
ncbi:hypothetical protein [Saccharibacillus alkalitolerans]|uniref:Uncharacterized protein n=1 Tax=Saccharibacillus alkalitolerans TaxID=2705290 RepID=A0ABX0F6A3_9BACL|nr:hypothetical protein [Saccharibacillus alkalitolerans]NGZ74696.1 hypothetical protein [Saccharibacillus alkalitolerans]